MKYGTTHRKYLMIVLETQLNTSSNIFKSFTSSTDITDKFLRISALSADNSQSSTTEKIRGFTSCVQKNAGQIWSMGQTT